MVRRETLRKIEMDEDRRFALSYLEERSSMAFIPFEMDEDIDLLSMCAVEKDQWKVVLLICRCVPFDSTILLAFQNRCS